MADVGGLVSGFQAGHEAQQDFRHARDRLNEATQQGLDEMLSRQKSYTQNPLLQGVKDQYTAELAGLPSQDTRYGLYNNAAAGVNNLGNTGLANPAVQDQMFRQTLEGSLIPAQQQAKNQMAAELAARGMGRSGQAIGQMSDLQNQFGTQATNLRRDLSVAGQQEAFNQQLAQAQAQENLFKTGQNAVTQIGQGAQAIGTQEESFLSDLAKFIATMRQNAQLALLGQNPNQSQYEGDAMWKFNESTQNWVKTGASAGAMM